MPLVNLAHHDKVAHVELNRPDARNALSLALVEELTEVLARLAGREDVHAVVLSGAGGVFASGADIAELRDRGHREALDAINGTLFQRVEELPQPTLAAIEGYALGGGLELALACDLRVAGRDAKLGLPEVTLGIFPAAGGTWRLPRLVGLGRAKQLVFTGKPIGGDEALALGLVERTCERGSAVATALAWAQEIAANAPLALRVAKLALNSAGARGHGAVERLGQAVLFESPDKRARMDAFLAGRKTKKD